MASLSATENLPANIFIPEEWSDASDTITYDSTTTPPPIAFICGAKNSGKTTFSRYLLNVLLQRYRKVAYLDTDVGQSEFTPPGCLSLTVLDKITPDLAIPCLKTPERCFFFGDISSKRDPAVYSRYISALYDHYRKEYCMFNKAEGPGNTGLPLVVNTPGWVKGIGYDILVDLLKYIAPTHVVKICISAASKNLPPGAFWLDEGEDAAVTLIEINSARQDSLKRSVLVQKDARLLRDLRMMAYFRQCFPSDMNVTTIKELARALAAHPPYEIPVSSIKIKHLFCQQSLFAIFRPIMFNLGLSIVNEITRTFNDETLHTKVPGTELFYSLNATIVGLAVSSEDSEDLHNCVGLGIVRGIDSFKGLVYVITPVPPSVLEKVDLLLQGFIQIPTCLLQVQGCVSPYMSSNVLPEN